MNDSRPLGFPCLSKLIIIFITITLLQYEDEDHDKVVLASDGDLTAAIDHARSSGWKV